MLEKIWQETANERPIFRQSGKHLKIWILMKKTVCFPFPYRLQIPSTDRHTEASDTRTGSTFYTITGWKTINTAGWTADTSQNVYVQTESADAEGE